jgi:urea carboxylase
LHAHADDIARFRSTQRAAFAAERERWRAAGQAEVFAEADLAPPPDEDALPPGARAVATQVPGGVWWLLVGAGQPVQAGDTLVVVLS